MSHIIDKVRHESKQNIINGKQIIIFDNKDRVQYDHMIRAQRKWLCNRVRNEIDRRNNSNIVVRKRIFKAEKRERKLQWIKQILLCYAMVLIIVWKKNTVLMIVKCISLWM